MFATLRNNEILFFKKNSWIKDWLDKRKEKKKKKWTFLANSIKCNFGSSTGAGIVGVLSGIESTDIFLGWLSVLVHFSEVGLALAFSLEESDTFYLFFLFFWIFLSFPFLKTKIYLEEKSFFCWWNFCSNQSFNRLEWEHSKFRITFTLWFVICSFF